MYSKVIIMLPTYNEAENISLLLDSILAVNPALEILVVDDNSPDGTWKIVSEKAKENNQIHLLHRREDRGRGKAGIEGFKYAVRMNADYIIEMDADFSHDPVFIPNLLDAVMNADVALGSRYIKDGRDCRGFMRRHISSLAGLYIRFVLGICIKDPTSGYRCFKKDILERINLDTLTANDPFIVTEVLYRCYKKNAKIVEVPIKFIDREKGTSKLGPKTLFVNLCKVLKLKFREPQ